MDGVPGCPGVDRELVRFILYLQVLPEVTSVPDVRRLTQPPRGVQHGARPGWRAPSFCSVLFCSSPCLGTAGQFTPRQAWPQAIW